MFFTKNVLLKSYKKISPWRKIAIGTWRTCGDPSVYSLLDIDVSPLLQTIEKFKTQGHRLTPTTLVARSVALCLKEYPQLNTLLSFGRLHERKTVDIFLQVAPDGEEDNLSGIVVQDFDKKSLIEISKEIFVKSSSARSIEK